VIGVNMLIQEITAEHKALAARDRAERRPHENEKRLALALEAGQFGVWDWHIPSGRLTYGGRRAAMPGHDSRAATGSGWGTPGRSACPHVPMARWRDGRDQDRRYRHRYRPDDLECGDRSRYTAGQCLPRAQAATKRRSC
jgi:hypothetical protein